MALLNEEKEGIIFEKMLESDKYKFDRAKNLGENYVESGKLDRDVKEIQEFVNSDAFEVIRKLR